jgi:gluconolactonase
LHLRSSIGERISILQYHLEFESLTGDSPLCTLLEKQPSVSLFHQACVYIPDRDELYITSNLLKQAHDAEQTIIISHLTFRRNDAGDIISRQFEKIRPKNFAMPSGGVNYLNNVLFCVQGDSGSTPGGIYYLDHKATLASALITNYHGHPFNSPNDVVVSQKDGGIWFTDPIYGFEQDFRPSPELPNQVYRFDPKTGAIRAVADGLGRPNGISFSPDESVVYITDTDSVHGNGDVDLTRASTM